MKGGAVQHIERDGAINHDMGHSAPSVNAAPKWLRGGLVLTTSVTSADAPTASEGDPTDRSAAAIGGSHSALARVAIITFPTTRSYL